MLWEEETLLDLYQFMLYLNYVLRHFSSEVVAFVFKTTTPKIVCITGKWAPKLFFCLFVGVWGAVSSNYNILELQSGKVVFLQMEKKIYVYMNLQKYQGCFLH